MFFRGWSDGTQLREHRQSDYITQLCATPFDPAAKCPTWLRFLNDIFPGCDADLIGFIQRFAGYSLTGDVSEQVLLILHGEGANGKSTLLNALMNLFGGDYSSKAPSTMLLATKNERHPTELAGLFGKRFVAAVETESGARLAESVVKEITGGDLITARRMKEDFWTFKPTHKLVLCTNHKPKIRGRDHAIWRRIRLVPFERRFTKEEQDKQLAEKLAAEAPGILMWMVRGCLEWQRKGLGEPKSVLAATADYQSTEDVLAAWLDDGCIVGNQTDGTRGKDLYADYQKWVDRSGEKYKMTARELYAALRGEGFSEYRNDGPAFRGIALRPFFE